MNSGTPKSPQDGLTPSGLPEPAPDGCNRLQCAAAARIFDTQTAQPTRIFTASQIARAIGLKRQSVQWHLREIRPDGTAVVKGATAHAWRYSNLPDSLKLLIEGAAQILGRSGERFLSSPPRRFQPKIPLSRLPQDCIDYAARLQRAQNYYLVNKESTLISKGDLMRHALEDYAREFGHSVTEKHCRDLLERTIERDAGENNWDDLNLYLPERLKEKQEAPATRAPKLTGLLEAIGLLKTPGVPTGAEQDLLWLRACETYDAGGRKKCDKRAVLDFLWKRATGLAKSPNALRVSFDRKFKAWRRKPDAAAIVDGREKRLGNFSAAPYDPEQIKLIKFTAATRHEGKVAPAVREVSERGLITDPRLTQHLNTRTSKSDLPKSFLENFKDVQAYRIAHLGPRAAEKMIPPRQLEYDGIYSMTCLVGDDLTSPVYVSSPDGEGWFKMTRCQLLAVADFRSLFITSFALNPSGQYNSLDVRTVFTTTFANHGMPHFILREGGLWRKSKNANSLAAIGNPRSEEAPFSNAEVEFGLERAGVRIKSSIDDLCRDVDELGMHFKEARRARSKPIERVFDLLQSLMAGEPGFCGRDEKVDCPEVVRRNLELVRTRKEHPASLGFYSYSQWLRRLEEIIGKYNQTPQEGRRLANSFTGEPLTPEQAFHAFRNPNDPPIRFDDSCSVLMSHMRIEVEVKKPNLRRRQFPCGYVVVRGNIYCNEETGRRIGQKLLAYYNPHRPETCTFTDLKRRNPFTVPRLESTNALFADEQTGAVSRQAYSPIGVVKTEFRAMATNYSHLLGLPFRRNAVDAQTAELNRHVNEQSAAADAKKRVKQSRGEEIRRKAKKLGMPSQILRNDEESRSALDEMEAARREHAAEQSASETEIST